MASSYTSLLGLVLPVQGELQGTWGDTVNNELTSLLDTAIAGTTTLNTDADVTLTDTDGTSNQARQQVILWTASGTVTRNITAPAQSKTYVVINATGSTQSIVIGGTGPTTGVTVVAGRAALVAWNGSDFALIATTDASKLSGTLAVANGGTGLTTFPALSIPVASTLNTLSALSATAGQSVRVNAGGSAWEAYTPSTGTGDAVLANNNAFTGANTFYNNTGQTFGTATSTQDGIVIAGRAGGSSSYRVTFQPGTLTAARTVTFPDETFTAGFRNIPAIADKTASYTLAVGDVGKVVGVGTGGSIEIPNSTFSAGDAVLIFNNTTGNITVTCTITTAYIAGTDTDKATVTLATRGVANILFISGTVCVITGNVS